jgi:MoaA/NifB/PqqE/SkfB family radical SAM enzyme
VERCSSVLLGFAVTQHCNLRCPHCIRDDVTTVRSLSVDLIERVTDEALSLYGPIMVSLTGGEPLVHNDFDGIVDVFASRGVPYRIVSNGWHIGRTMPILDRYPPRAVRLSLSGADRQTHDAERGRGSFDRVLLSVGILASRGIPASLSIVIDGRDLHQIEEAAELAESLGCARLHFILPQPVVGSAERGSDLPPREWVPVRNRVERLAALPGRKTVIALDYGAPFEGEEQLCDTFALRRIYVDAHGRVCSCCQLSDYGFNEAEVVADLNEVSLAEAHQAYVRHLAALREVTRPDPGSTDEFDRFPCMRCARACGKLDWLGRYPTSPWHGASRKSSFTQLELTT